MKRTTLLLLLSLLFLSSLCAFLGTQPVSAGGTVTNCTNDTDFNNKLAGGGAVNFSCGTATIPISSTKTISADTSIDGAGTITLDGGGTQRIFSVNAGVALTLTNITLRNAYANADGGAIYSSGTIYISGSKFYSNTADTNWSGGVIRTNAPLTIVNSEFAYNKAGNGGVLFPREALGLTSITGSHFHDNYTTNTTNG